MKPGNIKRILLIRIDFLGDMVCTTALMRSLKRRWPHAELHVLANKYNAPVLENNSDVSHVHHYVYSKKYEKNIRPGKLNALIDRCKLIIKLRKLSFDLLIVPNGGMNPSSIQFAKMLNAKDCRWHTPDSGFDDRIPSHIESRPIKHEALAGYALLPELGPVDIKQLRLHVSPNAELKTLWGTYFGEKMKPRVGFFVSNKSNDRRWEWEKWEKLAFLSEQEYEVIVFHAPNEVLPQQWSQNTPIRPISTPTVQDLIAALSHLDLVISADSAPVHLASALQIPTVALFESRPEKYLRWHPLGVKYVLLHEGKQVKNISVESVATAMRTLLNTSPAT